MNKLEIRQAALAMCVLLAASAAHAQRPANTPMVDVSPSAAPAATPAATTNVTTTGGTNGMVPLFTGASTVVNSLLQQYNGGIGIGRPPAATLDVNGKSIFRGGQIISRSGDATASTGYNSSPVVIQASVYNSKYNANLLPYFQLQTEPVANNTASVGATLNFLYYSGIGAYPAESGLYINGNGIIHFAPGQTFPTAAAANPASNPSAASSFVGIAGPKGDTGPIGPAGTAGPDIAVSGAINAGRGFHIDSSDASLTQFAGANSSPNAVVANLTATGANSYGLKTSGSVGVHAEGTYLAAEFSGNVNVSGNESASGSWTRIDHPLDPQNKYLNHASVESPEMMNIYSGNIVTDSSGSASVKMPEYFEALNRDFRYQLTVMGGTFAQAIIESEISGGAFTIKTDSPNVTVSWQVTGVRQDAWANAHRLEVEEDKADNDKGYFIHPELFGHANEASIMQRSLPSR